MSSQKISSDRGFGRRVETWVNDDGRLHRLDGPAYITIWPNGSRSEEHWIEGIRVPDNPDPEYGPRFWPEIVNGDLGIWTDIAEDGARMGGARRVLGRNQVTREVWFYAVRGMGLYIQPEPINGAQA